MCKAQQNSVMHSKSFDKVITYTTHWASVVRTQRSKMMNDHFPSRRAGSENCSLAPSRHCKSPWWLGWTFIDPPYEIAGGKKRFATARIGRDEILIWKSVATAHFVFSASYSVVVIMNDMGLEVECSVTLTHRFMTFNSCLLALVITHSFRILLKNYECSARSREYRNLTLATFEWWVS